MAVGEQSSVQQFIGPDTKTVDLQQATLLPGFIEPHTLTRSPRLYYPSWLTSVVLLTQVPNHYSTVCS